jgi:amino acid transporter
MSQSLGLLNLTLSQPLYIMGFFWIGVAAKLGPSHIVFWLGAMLLFYLPSAAAVIYLNRVHPVEGGLYEWSRRGFGEFTGFLVGWNMWVNLVMIISAAGVQVATMAAYAAGPAWVWLGENPRALAAITVVVVVVLAVMAIVGMKVDKWAHFLGAVVMLAAYLALMALPLRNHMTGRPNPFPAFSMAMPPISLLSLSVLGRMGQGAFGGFDAMAVFAGETRDARRTFAWSVILAAPIIALAYILGTGSLVSVVTPDKIDLVSPISQALTAGTRPGDPAANLIPLVIWALLLSFIAAMMLMFEVATRLPMVAGWNRLLPDWFGRLHPRRRTPVNSILFVASVALTLALGSTIGAGKQEAFQLLQNVPLSAMTYLAMFALPLFGRQTKIERPSWWLRAACISGFLMTALYVVLSLFPIIDVQHPLMYGAKVGGFAVLCELIAVALYWSRTRRTEQRAMAF